MATIAEAQALDDVNPRIENAVGTASVILTLTDAGREPSYRRSFSVALGLARRTGATLLLVDRSQETWGETPHHRGPFTPQELRLMGMRHLEGQLAQAQAQGVEVLVWVPSLPFPESYYEETLSHNRVDLAVLPERPQRPRIVEAIVGAFAARMAKLMAPSVPVVQVSRDGSLLLL